MAPISFRPRMIWIAPALIAVLPGSCLHFASPASAASAPETIIVELDRAKLVRLPVGLHHVVLGDSTIVRITKLPDNRNAVLTGLSFGETEMQVVDAKGAVIMTSTVRVELPSDGLIVQRGAERTTYDCGTQCQPGNRLGDSSKDSKDADSERQSRTGTAIAAPADSNKNDGAHGRL